jgi:hypothetical protein
LVLGVLSAAANASASEGAAARAAAIHECSVSAAKYLDYSWGSTEMYVYRTCMAGHRQQRE